MLHLSSSHLKEISHFFYVFRKAAIVIAAFSFSLCSFGRTVFAAAKSESYKDIITKAQNLVLQKERSQAIDLLFQSLKQESLKGTAFREIKKNMASIARAFMFEKAQQAYELAISMRRQDAAQAYKTIKDGLNYEPDNLNLLLILARTEVTKNECLAARETFNRIKKSLWVDEEVQLLQAQILFCGKESNEIQSSVTLDLTVSEWQRPQGQSFNHGLYWDFLELKKYEILKNDIKLQEKAKSLESSVVKNHPDLFYWKWRASSRTDIRKNQLGQKYILSCQGLSQRQNREYLIDPFLCQRVSDVEREIKKQGVVIEK
jgi:hypothetical protein